MRILVYKRTHNGDPDDGCFGVSDCMGAVRSRQFDAVIGVGGIGAWAQREGIAGKLNWVGVGPRKTAVRGYRGPLVAFDRFVDFGCSGADFRSLAPALAWYGIGAHLIGGSLLALGLWSRWAALAQIPVIASATFLLHFAQGFFLRGIILDAARGRAIAGGYEYTLLLLVATVALVLTGGGTLTLTAGRR